MFWNMRGEIKFFGLTFLYILMLYAIFVIHRFIVMETTRQSKIARLIQKEISEIFLGFTKNVQQGTLVSPTIVRISPDLSVARVYISVFPTNKEQEILKLVNDKAVSIRHDLAQRTRYQLRTVPTLTFFLDDSLDYLENIDQLLKG